MEREPRRLRMGFIAEKDCKRYQQTATVRANFRRVRVRDRRKRLPRPLLSPVWDRTASYKASTFRTKGLSRREHECNTRSYPRRCSNPDLSTF
jgi:hypothetical protein